MSIMEITVRFMSTPFATEKLVTRNKTLAFCAAFLIAVLALGMGRAAHQAASPAAPRLSKSFPSGALLYLQAKDFSSLLTDWNRAPQKQKWLRSDNYQVFSRSRLFLRLREAGNQFAAAAGLPPDMDFVGQMAGNQSALALYDIGKLQFLYITRVASDSAMQSQLWQTRSKFEARNAGGTTFYLRREAESDREVAFALRGDYLLLSTREDLLAGALQRMAGSTNPDLEAHSIESEPWWSQSVAAAGEAGDLRMVLNLEKIVPSPYFHFYWVQQNVTTMKQYASAISDLFRDSEEYREERVLLKKAADSATSALEPADVSDLLRLVPDNAGFYEAKACPSLDVCVEPLESKLLAPRLGPVRMGQLAPPAPVPPGEPGGGLDLETRIDEPPAPSASGSGGLSPLKDLLRDNSVRAVLEVQSTEPAASGVFISIHSAVALVGGADWSDLSVRRALTGFVQPGLTTQDLGMGWRQVDGYYELDGLYPLRAATRGKYLIISDDSALIRSLLANLNRKLEMKPAVFVAGFDHHSQRENLFRLTATLDRPDADRSEMVSADSEGVDRTPPFVSRNLASLSSALAAVSSERVVVHEAGDKVMQTVTYKWSQ